MKKDIIQQHWFFACFWLAWSIRGAGTLPANLEGRGLGNA